MSFDRRKPLDVESLVSVKIDNLSYRTSTDQLKRAFEKFGEIGDVYIPRDPYGHEASRGFGFVRFYDSRDADDAVHAMDGISLNGREIRVQLARHNRSHRADFVAPTRGRRNYSRRSRSRSRSRSRPRRRRSRSSSRDRYRKRSRSRSRSRNQKEKSRSSNSRKRDLSRSKSRSTKRYKTEENGNDQKRKDLVSDVSEQASVMTDVEAVVGDVECTKSDLEGDTGYNLEHPSALNEENSTQEDGDDNNNNYQHKESVPGDGTVEDRAMEEVEKTDKQNESGNSPGDVNDDDLDHDSSETDEEFKPDDQREITSVQNCEEDTVGSGACEDDDDEDNDTIDNTSENGGFVDGDRYSGNTDEDSCSRDVGNENSCDKKEDSEDDHNGRADKCDED